MEEEISRVNRFVITMQMTSSGERKFALRYLPEPGDKQGILAIQHLLTEEMLREIASAFGQAVEQLDHS
ncbi:hypothetical protein ACFL7E_00365 [Thermodesulfobacteriota bacterium]